MYHFLCVPEIQMHNLTVKKNPYKRNRKEHRKLIHDQKGYQNAKKKTQPNVKVDYF